MRSQKAFTLIEMIVAIILLGMLALMTIGAYTAVVSATKQASGNNSALSTARDAVAIAATQGRPPTNADINVAVTEVANVTVVSAMGTLASPNDVYGVKFLVTGSPNQTVCIAMPAATDGSPKIIGTGSVC